MGGARSSLIESADSVGTMSHDEESIEPGHCHKYSKKRTDANSIARRKLMIGSVLCFLFMVGEMTGGIFANSLAIAADAAHLFSDLVGFSIGLTAICLSSRARTRKKSFGFHRAEVLGALFSIFLIWLITGILVYMAVMRCVEGSFEIDSVPMLITSVVGIVMNILMVANFHHGHSHGHSQIPTMLAIEAQELRDRSRIPRSHMQAQNVNLRAAIIHAFSDLIQSVGVLIAALIIYFKPEYKLADPICTFVSALLVSISTVSLTKELINILMEGTPSRIQFSEVKKALRELYGVKAVHNLRIWTLTMDHPVLSVHLVIDDYNNSELLLHRSLALLSSYFNITEATIQIEQYTPDMKQCSQCKDPWD